MKTNRIGMLILVFLVLALNALSAQAQRPARERLSLNADWRFQKSDPTGTEGQLAYGKIRPWVIATGNEFLRQAPRPARPEGNPGADIPYVQKDFDDRRMAATGSARTTGASRGRSNRSIRARRANSRGGASAGIASTFKFPQRQAANDSTSTSTARCPTRPSGSTASSSAAGLTATLRFELDLTPYVEFGAENVIAIRLDNPPDSSRWYPGGGIYRNVWLVKTAPVHVAHGARTSRRLR